MNEYCPQLKVYVVIKNRHVKFKQTYLLHLTYGMFFDTMKLIQHRRLYSYKNIIPFSLRDRHASANIHTASANILTNWYLP